MAIVTCTIAIVGGVLLTWKAKEAAENQDNAASWWNYVMLPDKTYQVRIIGIVATIVGLSILAILYA